MYPKKDFRLMIADWDSHLVHQITFDKCIIYLKVGREIVCKELCCRVLVSIGCTVD
jgi:hypothetical protein